MSEQTTPNFLLRRRYVDQTQIVSAAKLSSMRKFLSVFKPFLVF